MTTNELFVLFGFPIGALVIYLFLRRRSALQVWSVMLGVIVAGVALASFAIDGDAAAWPASTLVLGGSLSVMIWVLHRPYFGDRPVLQAIVAVPVYLVSFAVFVMVGVALGILVP